MNHNECQDYVDPVSNRLKKLTEANRSLAEIESLDDCTSSDPLGQVWHFINRHFP